MISEKSIDEVKARLNIKEVVGGFVELKKNGVNYIALCPFHQEKSPSFTVSPAKHIYKCFGCGRSGDAIEFVIEHKNVTYLEAIRILAEKYNVKLDEEGKKEFVAPVPRLEKLGPKALKWFEEQRLISNNTLLRFGITEAIEFVIDLKRKDTVICFNYFQNEKLVNIKFRGPQKSFQLAKDAKLILYNLDAIKDETECVITEGEIDCLTMYECGIYNAVSVPNGAVVGKQKLEYLDNCFEYFAGKTKVVLATDNDDPGRALKEELSRRIGKDKCYEIVYPEGCKDANEVLLKFGKEAVKRMISDAKRLPIEGEILVEDMYEEVMDYYFKGYPPGDAAKIPGFDELLTFAPGLLTMVTGQPGSGKDEFVNYISTSLTKFHDWRWGYWPMEEPAQITLTKLAEKFTQKAFAHRIDPSHRMTEKELNYSIELVKKYYHFINVNRVDITVGGVIKKAKELVERYGINGMVISPWNCLEHKMQFGLTETLYVSEKITELISFLTSYGVHCFLLAHPRKMNKNRQTGKYDIPTLYDINGSANFYNKTHNGFCVCRDFDTGEVYVYVQKVKFYWHGKLGFCSFSFNKNTRQYDVVGSSMPSAIQSELGEGNWKQISKGTF